MTGGDYDRFLRGRFPVGVRTIQAFDADGVRAFSCEIWYPAAATYAGEDRRRSASRNVPADYFLARQLAPSARGDVPVHRAREARDRRAPRTRRFTVVGQYRPPSLRWSQLTTFSGTILSTTRFGALASAPGWTGDAFACAPVRPSNAALTLASSSRISQRPRIITPRSSAYSSPASIISATLGLRRMLTTFCAFP